MQDELPDLPELTEINRAAWAHLANATGTPSAPLRCLTLGSVAQDGTSQLRTLILRAVDPSARSLTFHTDIRSVKWAELTRDPRASILGYDAGLRIQLRLMGAAALFGPGSKEQAAAWDALPPWNRNAYCGGPPGHAVAAPDVSGPRDAAPTNEDTAAGKARFGVISFTAKELDWYQHGRGRNMRARFDYEPATQSWVTP